MKKIFITGSTTGLGLLAGQLLMKQGHSVILHARSDKSSMTEKVPYVIGDISNIDCVKSVAEQVNASGPLDVIIHNAGVYTAGSEELFNVNVLAPYLLTTLLPKPERIVFLSSGMHLGGHVNLLPDHCSYSDTKLYDLMLAKYFARKWPDTFINAVDPGWVPTRMGGPGAPDSLLQGAETQAWLAVSDESAALVSGKYFHHKKQHKSHPEADSEEAQNKLITYLENRV
jgi:NAD(P)-dependent dehydrogenase (short-subunit alcohol dehydrogenase family)